MTADHPQNRDHGRHDAQSAAHDQETDKGEPANDGDPVADPDSEPEEEENSEPDDLKLTMLCLDYAIPFVIICILIAFDALMIYEAMTRGLDTVTATQLSMLAAINLFFLFVGITGLAYQCCVQRRRRKNLDDAPRCLDGRLIRSDLVTTCPICLEAINRGMVFMTPCQHKFHPHCLQECLENAIHQCPICRLPISSVSNDPTTPN